MPNLLCSYCYEEVTHFNLFRNKALENDKLLREILKSQNYTESVYFENPQQDDVPLYSSNLTNLEENELNMHCTETNIVPIAQIDTAMNNKFECNICNKIVTSSASLRRHLKLHTGNKPHECSFCSKRFYEQGNLQKHLRLHKKVTKNHECNECGLKFYDRCKLNIHLRSHTGEKFHVCSICNRAFSTKSQVQVHMKVINSLKYSKMCNCI